MIAHDGFTLHDLVAFNEKHNGANGEGNRDGTNDNFSWNCGVEGSTSDKGVLALRGRQMRNLMLALLLSQGTPMVLSGAFMQSIADNRGESCLAEVLDLTEIYLESVSTFSEKVQLLVCAH